MNDIDNQKECIKFLNTILKKLNVRGFYFGFGRYVPTNIALFIPREIDDGYVFQHCEFESIKHMFSTNTAIRYLLIRIKKAKLRGNNGTDTYNPVNVLGINDSGIEFLKLLDRCIGCSSLLEFEMKLQLMGYEI
jgi:hypothetical protein